MKKKQGIPITEKKKCKDYFQTIIWLWAMVLVVFMMCFIGEISLKNIGFQQISFNYSFWFTAVVLLVNGLLLVYSLYILIFSLASAKFRETALKEAHSGTIMVLPRSKKEQTLYFFVALSAGVCEEIVFRGFLLFLILAIFPDIPIYFAAIIPCVLFGISHLYQGLGGVIWTAVIGAIYMFLFIVTDSLIPGILLHFFFDFSSTFILSEEDK
jgi:membrane protease YdiL (CAAX protease family)